MAWGMASQIGIIQGNMAAKTLQVHVAQAPACGNMQAKLKGKTRPHIGRDARIWPMQVPHFALVRPARSFKKEMSMSSKHSCK